MLKLEGDLVVLGFQVVNNLFSISWDEILFGGRRKFYGSLIGSVAEI